MTNTIRKMVARGMAATQTFRRRLRRTHMAMNAVVYQSLPGVKRKASKFMRFWHSKYVSKSSGGTGSSIRHIELPTDDRNDDYSLGMRVLLLPDEIKLQIIRYLLPDYINPHTYKVKFSPVKSVDPAQEIIAAFAKRVVWAPNGNGERTAGLNFSFGRILQSEMLRVARLVTLDVTKASKEIINSLTEQHQPIRRLRLVGQTYIKPRDGVALVDPFLKLDFSPSLWMKWRLLRHLEINPRIWDVSAYRLNKRLHICSEQTSIAQLVFDYSGTLYSFRKNVRRSNYDFDNFKTFNQPLRWYVELEELAKRLPMTKVELLIIDHMYIEGNRKVFPRLFADRLRFTFVNETHPLKRVRFEKHELTGAVHWDVAEPWI